MRVSMVRIFMVLLFALGACSGEDQKPPQTPPPKVVQPIKPSTADIEKPTTTVAEEKPQGEEKASTEKAAPSPDKPGTASKPAAEEKKAASEEPPATQAKKKDKGEPGLYTVKRGDTLSSIAARPDVLKDPLRNQDQSDDRTRGQSESQESDGKSLGRQCPVSHYRRGDSSSCRGVGERRLPGLHCASQCPRERLHAPPCGFFQEQK